MPAAYKFMHPKVESAMKSPGYSFKPSDLAKKLFAVSPPGQGFVGFLDLLTGNIHICPVYNVGDGKERLPIVVDGTDYAVESQAPLRTDLGELTVSAGDAHARGRSKLRLMDDQEHTGNLMGFGFQKGGEDCILESFRNRSASLNILAVTYDYDYLEINTTLTPEVHEQVFIRTMPADLTLKIIDGLCNHLKTEENKKYGLKSDYFVTKFSYTPEQYQQLKENYPIHFGALVGELDCNKLSGTSDINSMDHTGRTPLRYAILKSNLNMVTSLINAEAILGPAEENELIELLKNEKHSWDYVVVRDLIESLPDEFINRYTTEILELIFKRTDDPQSIFGPSSKKSRGLLLGHFAKNFRYSLNKGTYLTFLDWSPDLARELLKGVSANMLDENNLSDDQIKKIIKLAPLEVLHQNIDRIISIVTDPGQGEVLCNRLGPNGWGFLLPNLMKTFRLDDSTVKFRENVVEALQVYNNSQFTLFFICQLSNRFLEQDVLNNLSAALRQKWALDSTRNLSSDFIKYFQNYHKTPRYPNVEQGQSVNDFVCKLFAGEPNTEVSKKLTNLVSLNKEDMGKLLYSILFDLLTKNIFKPGATSAASQKDMLILKIMHAIFLLEGKPVNALAPAPEPVINTATQNRGATQHMAMTPNFIGAHHRPELEPEPEPKRERANETLPHPGSKSTKI